MQSNFLILSIILMIIFYIVFRKQNEHYDNINKTVCYPANKGFNKCIQPGFSKDLTVSTDKFAGYGGYVGRPY